jgi:hypothetical protein
LSGPEAQTVSVTIGGVTRDMAQVAFAVACAATTGDVDVSTTTTGTHRDINGYTLMVDGTLVMTPDLGCYYYYYCYEPIPVRLGINGVQDHLVQQLVPGAHTIELTDIAPNCSVSEPNPVTVSVTLGAVSEIEFTVACD